MFGLRAENDQSSTSFFSTAQNRKTYRFAERYNGRFFVSGVSGSFAKYTKQLKETDKKYLQNEKKVERKYTYEPLLEKHQKEELRRDAQRLLEMEEQLNQLQKMRELKRQRDRSRRKKKMEYNAACTIQRAYRRFKLNRSNKSADILKSFLRTLAAQHSISAACWAASVLKKFAIKTSYLWVEKKFQRKQAKIVALKNWYNIRDAACVYTVARRAATDEFVFNCINAGVRLANKAIIDSGVLLRPKKDKKDKNAHKHGKRKQSSSRHGGANDHLQFFLTEFDSHDANGGDSVGTGGSGDSGDDDDTCFGPDGESDADSDDLLTRGINTRKSLRLINKERGSVEDLTLSMQAAARLRKLRPAKVYSADNPEHRRIMALHRKKLADYSAERLRRVQAVDQKKEQAEKEAVERQKQEELQKQANEQAKKEYYAKLAHEERVKARAITKARMDREAAKVKKQALEQQERAERSAMQVHDKLCYQALPSAPAVSARVKKSASARPSSGRPARAASPSIRGAAGVGSDSETDWAVVQDPDSTTAPADPSPVANANATSALTGISMKGSAFPSSSKSVKIKAPVVIDQAAVDQQYYQSALPPKRPHVPRVNSENAVSMAKKKKEEEMAAIEQEALIQLEVRRQKFTSDEAVQRSRLAVKRRVAAKLEREAQKAREAEEAEAERAKKMQQIAELAQQRLKKDLEKKRRKAAERRRELGIDTPPDPYAVGLTALAAVKMRRRRQKKTTGASESDASLSAEELAPVSKDPQLSGVQLRMQGEGEDGSGSKVGGSATVRQSSAGGRYDNIDDEENLSEDEEGGAKSRVKRPDGGGGGAEGEGECGGESGDSFDPDEDHEDDNSDGGEEGDDDDEQGPDEEGDQQGNEGNEGQQEDGSGNDSDSLDAMLAGLTHKLRQQSEQPLSINPKAHLEVSTRSNSAGANDSPVRSINRNTSSGGSDTRKLTATYYSSLSPTASASNSNSSRKSQQLGISERDRLHSAFERAEISSAHENFEDLMENFEAENFLNQSSVVQLFRTNTSGELVEGADENRDFPSENPSSRNKSRNVKPKLSTGASSKKIVIPRHLQNTPYFKHYKKHSDAALVESKSSAQFTSSDGGANVKGADNYGNSAKTGSKVPLLARKKQLAEQAASGSAGGGIALGASASAPTLPLDEDLLQFQQNQQKPGKVASLLEMVTKARMKLKKQGGGGGGGASDTDTDNEAATQIGTTTTAAHNNGAAHAPQAPHAVHILSALHMGPGSHPPGHHVHKAGHPPSHPPDPSSRSNLTAATATATATAATTTGAAAAISGLNYKVSTDAELDALVPSIQPPSVPQLLPVMSFRKAQSNIPLPPLSKDNLTILLKGKDPDSFASTGAGAITGAGFSGGAGFSSSKGVVVSEKKVKKKASKKNVKAAAEGPPVLPTKKASLPKEAKMASEKKANVSKFIAAKNKAQGRYASVDDDDDEGHDEDDEPQTLSPEQQYQQRLLRENLRQSQVRFAPDVDENEADDANGSDSEQEGKLQAEYSRLREEFNAKLQQAAAYNQVRNSVKVSSSGDFAAGRADNSAGVHDGVDRGEYYDEDAYAGVDNLEGGDGQEQEEEGGQTAEEIAASGSVTRSYSEGVQKVSTQELLRMWAIEDAEEEARKLAERQHPHNSHDSNINQNSSDNSREMGYGGTTCESAAAGAIRMGVGYEDDAHEERTDSEEEFLRERREKRREKRAKHASAQAKVAAVASATPPTAIAIPNSVVSVDDPALDAECLSFLNKMSMKIPTK